MTEQQHPLTNEKNGTGALENRFPFNKTTFQTVHRLLTLLSL